MTTVWQQALERLEGHDLLQLGMDADAVRQQLLPERVVTYTVGHALVLGSANHLALAEAAVERGARTLVLQTQPSATLPEVLACMADLRLRFAEVSLTGFTSEEVLQLTGGVAAGRVLAQLQDAGLAVLGMGRLETSSAWLRVHEAAHGCGLPSVASVALRREETGEQWVERLEAVAALQEKTQGFLACEPRVERMERALDEVTGARYLEFVALARLYLRNVPHIQADWSIFGPKVLQLALRCGADDAGLVPASERDVRTPSHHSGEEELRRIIREAGFLPVERDARYSRSFLV